MIRTSSTEQILDKKLIITQDVIFLFCYPHVNCLVHYCVAILLIDIEFYGTLVHWVERSLFWVQVNAGKISQNMKTDLITHGTLRDVNGDMVKG